MALLAWITCLCGRNVQRLALADVEVTGCCCNACRYSTGVLYITTLYLASAPEMTDKMTLYQPPSLPGRLFCAHCGSHMFIHYRDSWKVCSGVVGEITNVELDLKSTDLLKLVRHQFVADTLDGGVSICLPSYDGNPVAVFNNGPDESPDRNIPKPAFVPVRNEETKPRPKDTKIVMDSTTGQDQKLEASCHCGGVKFYVTRPMAKSKDPVSPFPDLLVPYHSSSSANPADVKWWLRENETKFLAGTCACRSCRLGSGFPIQAWAFIPKINLVTADDGPIEFNQGSMKQYKSSTGTYREFCRGCGATIFWHCEERPQLIDVSVGLLRANDGSRAKSWLSWWTQRVSFKEDAFDQRLIETLEIGLRNID